VSRCTIVVFAHRSQNVGGCRFAGSDVDTPGLNARRKRVNEDMIVAVNDNRPDLVLKSLELSGAEAAFKDAALHMVEIPAAEPEDPGVAFGRGVVYHYDIHGHHQIWKGLYGAPSRQARVSFNASRYSSSS